MNIKQKISNKYNYLRYCFLGGHDWENLVHGEDEVMGIECVSCGKTITDEFAWEGEQQNASRKILVNTQLIIVNIIIDAIVFGVLGFLAGRYL